jgi:hypothetical protein
MVRTLRFRVQLVLALAVPFAFLAAPRLARADVAPPDAYACDTNAAPGYFDAKKIGNACQLSDGQKGTCQKATCQGIDYANWDRDASPTAPSKSFDCLKCVQGASASASGSAAPTATTADGGTAAPKSDSSSCSLTGVGLGHQGPWLLALVLPLVVRRARRRR